jgi:hypothetical protein
MLEKMCKSFKLNKIIVCVCVCVCIYIYIYIYISPINNQGTNQPNIGSMCYHDVGLEVRIPI